MFFILLPLKFSVNIISIQQLAKKRPFFSNVSLRKVLLPEDLLILQCLKLSKYNKKCLRLVFERLLFIDIPWPPKRSKKQKIFFGKILVVKKQFDPECKNVGTRLFCLHCRGEFPQSMAAKEWFNIHKKLIKGQQGVACWIHTVFQFTHLQQNENSERAWQFALLVSVVFL